jgi:hypothetical protein
MANQNASATATPSSGRLILLALAALAGLVGLCPGCANLAAYQRARAGLANAASHVLITGTENVPSHSYRILGPVKIDGETIYRDCTSPTKLAAVALQQYGSVDAIVGYRTSEAGCLYTSGVSLCNTACEGTAVEFTDQTATP